MPLDISGINDAFGLSEDPEHEAFVDKIYDDALEFPFQLTDIDAWKNYTDDELYAVEKKFRVYLKETRSQRVQGKNKTALHLIFAYIYGRKPTPEDTRQNKTIKRVLEHYSTKVTGRSEIHGKPVAHVYYLTKNTHLKKPLSLRLQLEESGGVIGRAAARSK